MNVLSSGEPVRFGALNMEFKNGFMGMTKCVHRASG